MTEVRYFLRVDSLRAASEGILSIEATTADLSDLPAKQEPFGVEQLRSIRILADWPRAPETKNTTAVGAIQI